MKLTPDKKVQGDCLMRYIQFVVAALFVQTDIAAQDYTLYSFQLMATGSTSTLTFNGQNDNAYLSLDDVSVTAVGPTSTTPEPGAFGLLVGLSVAGTGLAFRRLRRR